MVAYTIDNFNFTDDIFVIRENKIQDMLWVSLTPGRFFDELVQIVVVKYFEKFFGRKWQLIRIKRAGPSNIWGIEIASEYYIVLM